VTKRHKQTSRQHEKWLFVFKNNRTEQTFLLRPRQCIGAITCQTGYQQQLQRL